MIGRKEGVIFIERLMIISYLVNREKNETIIALFGRLGLGFIVR